MTDDAKEAMSGAVIGVIVWLVVLCLCSDACGADVAQRAASILRTYCYQCHGVERNGNDDYDVSNFDYLRGAGYAVPGSPSTSKIMRRVTSTTKPMPPKDQPQLSAADINVLEQWITDGAKTPSGIAFDSSPDRYVLRHILADLRKHLAGQANNFRYISFANVPAESLAEYHAALSKALNSLSMEPSIEWPTTIDEIGMVLRIDQRDYGWNDAQWAAVLAAYPYFESPAYIRGDWFIANALKPPIYNNLLRLPKTERELEQLVEIDTRANIRAERVVRAGLQQSGIAFHNRVIERHPTRFGSYWKSYDFATSEGRQNVLRFPLGPRGTGFDNEAFEENGAEIIFSLPNGLHGYYVANAKGQRLDAAPTNIVADKSQVSGTLDIVPGISCIACHKQGIQDKFTDVVRFGTRFQGEARSHLLALYVQPERMQSFVRYDQGRYLAAVQTASGTQSETIGPVAIKYQEPVDIATATAEAGGQSVAQVATAIAVDEQLRNSILPLARGQKILRAAWESKEQGQSPAQRLADLLKN